MKWTIDLMMHREGGRQRGSGVPMMTISAAPRIAQNLNSKRPMTSKYTIKGRLTRKIPTLVYKANIKESTSSDTSAGDFIGTPVDPKTIAAPTTAIHPAIDCDVFPSVAGLDCS